MQAASLTNAATKDHERSERSINDQHRSRGRRRAHVGTRQKDTSPSAKQPENKLTPPRYELGVQGFCVYRRGGQKQTWNVNETPRGLTDLSRKKYSVNWLCQRGQSKKVQNYISELPETLSKVRLSPKSKKRRYPFKPCKASTPLRPAQSILYGSESVEMDFEFENDNKQQRKKLPLGGTRKGNLASGFDYERKENVTTSDSKQTFFTYTESDNNRTEAVRRPSAAKAKPARGIHQSLSQMALSGQPREKEKPGMGLNSSSGMGLNSSSGMGSNSSFMNRRIACSVFKSDDVEYHPGLRKAAGPISRPQPNGQVKEKDKPQRFSNSTLKGAERDWLRHILNDRLRKYSVKPHKLAIVSKTISTSLVTELIPLGYVCVPSPRRNEKGLTQKEKVVLSVQHEIRKMYNAAKLEAKKNANKYRGFFPQEAVVN